MAVVGVNWFGFERCDDDLLVLQLGFQGWRLWSAILQVAALLDNKASTLYYIITIIRIPAKCAFGESSLSEQFCSNLLHLVALFAFVSWTWLHVIECVTVKKPPPHIERRAHRADWLGSRPYRALPIPVESYPTPKYLNARVHILKVQFFRNRKCPSVTFQHAID